MKYIIRFIYAIAFIILFRIIIYGGLGFLIVLIWELDIKKAVAFFESILHPFEMSNIGSDGDIIFYETFSDYIKGKYQIY